MRQRVKPVIAYNCPHCGNQTVVQQQNGPLEILEWEDTLFVEVVFECTHCEWTDVVARYPMQATPAGGGY